MNYPKKTEVEKLSFFYRVLTGFVLFCSVTVVAGVSYAAIVEPFHPTLIIGGIVMLLMAYISGSITFKGYAPKYILFAHGQKNKFHKEQSLCWSLKLN